MCVQAAVKKSEEDAAEWEKKDKDIKEREAKANALQGDEKTAKKAELAQERADFLAVICSTPLSYVMPHLEQQ